MDTNSVLNTPLISVVMPVYNAGPYLHEAIASVLRQTETDFELLLIDDASTDESPAIMDSFQDARIRRVRHSENQGLIASLNEGYHLANGTYIARMDADDLCHPERFKKQRQLLDAHPKIGVCGTWVQVFGDRQEQWQYPEHHEGIKAGLLYSCCIAHPSVMLRKAMLLEKNAGYEPAYAHGEDYKLWVTLMTEGIQFYNIPEVLLQYRMHGGQISSTRQAQQQDSCNRARVYYLNVLFRSLRHEDVELHNRLANLDYAWDDAFITQSIALMQGLEQAAGNAFSKTCLHTLFQRKAIDVAETALVKNARAWRMLQRSPYRLSLGSAKGLKVFIKYLLKLCYLL